MESLANGTTKPFGYYSEGSWQRFQSIGELTAYVKRMKQYGK